MKRAMLILLILTLGMAFAQGEADYIGSKKCKICHNKAEKGSQFDKWSAGPHAKAYETLLTDASKAIAKKQGLKTAPENSPECLVCHVTGWGHSSGYQLTVDTADARAVKTNDDLKAVGCESCHGPGSLYKSKSKMTEITAGTLDGATLGLIEPNEANCVTCHNEKSPTYKPFKYADRVKEVSHDDPTY